MQPGERREHERSSLRLEATHRPQILPALSPGRAQPSPGCAQRITSTTPANVGSDSRGDILNVLELSPAQVSESLSDLQRGISRIAVNQRLCGFSPSAQSGIDKLLEVLHLTQDDTFFDLGCGDGRIVTAVVKHFGCKGVGLDVNGTLIRQAKQRAAQELAAKPELLEKTSFLQMDISLARLEEAKAVYIYMPQDALHTLISKVLPGTGLQDGTLVYTEEYWPQCRAALRHLRWKASHWQGQLHCYAWREAYGLKERETF